MLPILITLIVTVPILAIGTWLYLRRRMLSSRIRILLMLILFLFVLASGPAIVWMWFRGSIAKEITSTGSGGAKFLIQIPVLWIVAVCMVGVQFFRLLRRKGEL